jgi:hypothetical protein
MDSKYKDPAVLRPDLIHKATEKRVVELLAENEKLKAQLDRAICAWTDMHWKYREIVNLLDGIEPARWDYQLPEYEKKRKHIMEGE